MAYPPSMMPLVYTCIAPHGSEIIPELAPKNDRKFRSTREGMLRLAREVKDARPSLVVIATPHNLRLWKKIAVVTAQNSSGILSEGSKSIRFRAKCDVKFARQLVERAEKRKLPAVGANYGTTEGPLSNLPMDWGTLVPLWFMIKLNKIRPRIVIIAPSREIPLRQNIAMGEVLGDLAEKSSKRVVFVASADQAHAHKKSGPYGFSKMAAEYDKRTVDAIRSNRLESILEFNNKMIEEAKPDSLWQMAMLVGVMHGVRLRAHLHSYAVPTYFGMLCAGFTRQSVQS